MKIEIFEQLRICAQCEHFKPVRASNSHFNRKYLCTKIWHICEQQIFNYPKTGSKKVNGYVPEECPFSFEHAIMIDIKDQ